MTDALALVVGSLALLSTLAGRWLRREPTSAPLAALTAGLVLGPLTDVVELPAPTHCVTRRTRHVLSDLPLLRESYPHPRPGNGFGAAVAAAGFAGPALTCSRTVRRARPDPPCARRRSEPTSPA